MLADNQNVVQTGGIGQDVHPPSMSKIAIVDFIAQELPRWRDDPERRSESSETILTSQLCSYLNASTRRSNVWSHIQFQAEVGDETKTGRKIDLAAQPSETLWIEQRRHSKYDIIFPIECKRLPTPNGTNRDEREYVINAKTTGGLQRFKFGYHAASHNFAAMIAYVQVEGFLYWVNKINEWIRDLSRVCNSQWNELDLLQVLENGSNHDLYVLNSCHQRVNIEFHLDLRHLWIKMY
ncbi:hypothetical protein [Armatimonas sp.]|uniref:hypothetical protein n=1 Tax=Armatimonas sp. TaxID=1872638 RepID=UPI00286B6F69|nr:hypothetical protein [Armatimonas sp.]